MEAALDKIWYEDAAPGCGGWGWYYVKQSQDKVYGIW